MGVTGSQSVPSASAAETSASSASVAEPVAGSVASTPAGARLSVHASQPTQDGGSNHGNSPLPARAKQDQQFAVPAESPAKPADITTPLRTVHIMMRETDLDLSDSDREAVRSSPAVAGPAVFGRLRDQVTWKDKATCHIGVGCDRLMAKLLRPACGPLSLAAADQMARSVVADAAALDGRTYFFSGGGAKGPDMVFDEQWRLNPPETELLFNNGGSGPSEPADLSSLPPDACVCRVSCIWI